VWQATRQIAVGVNTVCAKSVCPGLKTEAHTEEKQKKSALLLFFCMSAVASARCFKRAINCDFSPAFSSLDYSAGKFLKRAIMNPPT